MIGVLALAIVMPMGYLVWGAFQSDIPGSPDAQFTVANVVNMFTSPSFYRSLRNTLLLSFSVASLVTVFSTAIAVAFVRIVPYLSGVLRLGLIAPLFVSPFVATVAWVTLYMPDAGLVNRLLVSVGLPQLNLYTVPGTIILMAVVFGPYGFILISDAMNRTNPELEHAAKICGAKTPRTLRTVTLPMLTPALVSVFTITFVLSAEMFSIPGVLATRERFFTLAYQIYFETVRYPINLPGSAAAGLVLSVISIVGLLVHLRMTRLHSRFVSVGGKAASGQTTPARKGIRLALTAAIMLYSLVTLVVPLLALVFRTLVPYFGGAFDPSSITFQAYADLLTSPAVLDALKNSLTLGAGAIVVAVVIAGYVGYSTVRRTGPVSRTMNFIANLPLGVPGTVFAAALIWAYIGTPVYGTLLIIAIAIYASWLPIAVRTVQTSVMQTSPELGDAADLAGASAWQKMRLILMPLMRSGLAAGAIVAFIISFNEVSASLLLISGRTVTVPTMVFSYMFDGNYARASVLAVMQVVTLSVVVAALSSLLSVRRRKKTATQSSKAVA